jgi:hypothetical protein
MKTASVTKLSSGVKSIVIPNTMINNPDRSSNHFATVSVFFKFNTPSKSNYDAFSN